MKPAMLCLISLATIISALADEPAKPGQFLSHPGTYNFTNTTFVTVVNLQTNSLAISSRTAASKASASAPSWQIGPGWFVYVGKDLHVWAFDGGRNYWFMKGSESGASTSAMERADEAPPAAVARRLLKKLRDALP